MFGSNVLKGVLLLARGKAAGIAEFGSTNDALLASLAPLIAFPLVATVLIALRGQPEPAVESFLCRLCVVLAVSVATQALAAMAKRETFWVRTATALNWSFWLIIPLLLLAGFAGAIMVAAGIPQMLAIYILIAVMAAYLFWFNWFTVHCGLQVGGLAAVGIVLLTNMIVLLLSVAPVMIDHVMATP
jgi:hypothetical protein